MKLTWFVVAPYAAGSPPALVMYFFLYQSILSASGDNSFWPLAAIIALIGVVAMVGTEAYTYQTAARAFAEGEIRAFIIALAGALLCSGVVVYAVYNGVNTRALIASVIFSIVLYIALANNTYLDTVKKNRLILVTEGTHEKELDIELEKQRASKARADARSAKMGGVQRQTNGVQPQGRYTVDNEKVKRIQEYWDTHPNASTRDAAKYCGCSPSTAGKYRPQ
jgi:hypothetical protein